MYFYDNQVRRYIAQFLRIFSDINFRTSPDENGMSFESRVPIKYGDMSRQVASILNSNTENVVLTVPSMAGYVKGLEIDSANRMDPMLVTTANIAEQEFDSVANSYEAKKGNSYSIERYMPVPYILTMRLDIMTSNTDTKLQILEQILTIFNPSIQLQQNENVADWSRVFEVEMTHVEWSNRNVPVNSDTNYDIASLDFKMNIWINPAAKEKRERVIKNIITRVFDSNEEPLDWETPFSNEITRVQTTSENLYLEVSQDASGYHGKLLLPYGVEGETISWSQKLETVGDIIPNHSRIKLRLSDDIEDESGDVYGLITSVGDTDPDIINFNIDMDTMPATINESPFSRFIDPLSTYPGNGIDVNSNAEPLKYLLLSDNPTDLPLITVTNANWGGLEAYANDIIEYSNGTWYVVFSAASSVDGVYAICTDDGAHYKFASNEWSYTLLGEFTPTYWAIMDVRQR
jgi:hypothetical protein